MPYTPPPGERMAFNLTGAEYEPPEGTSLSFDLLTNPPYVPPFGNAVALNFTGEYTAPEGNAVPLEFAQEGGSVPGDAQYLFPVTMPSSVQFGDGFLRLQYRFVVASGFATQEFGAQFVRLGQRYVKAGGTNFQAFGTTRVINQHRPIYPNGFDPARYGNATVINKNRYLQTLGWHSLAWGAPIRVINWRTIARPNGFNAQLFGTATLSGGVRTVTLANRGPNTALYGTQWVSFRVRPLSPKGLNAFLPGVPLIGWSRTIEPHGFDATRWGDAFVDEVSVDPVGFDAQEFGQSFVAMRIRRIYPPPLMAGVPFGHVEIFNSMRRIMPYSDFNGWDPKWGAYTEIYNRNMTLRPTGHPYTFFGYHNVALGARVIAPPGIPATAFGDTLVSHKIRTYVIGGDSYQQFSNYNAIYNAARLLRPTGPASEVFGTGASVVNTRRFVKQVGHESTEFGAAMIGDRVRVLAPYFGYVSPGVGYGHRVSNLKEYITPSGFDASRFGLTYFYEHHSVIVPRWIPRNWWGYPRIHNRNAEIATLGFNHQELPRPHIHNKLQSLRITGESMARIGTHAIIFRNRTVYGRGHLSLQISSYGNIVALVQPNLPTTRYILINAMMDRLAFGRPSIQTNSIFPEGFSTSRYGGPEVIYMGISPLSLFEGEMFGEPSLNFPQSIGPNGFSHTGAGKPGLSPLTLWATFAATDQAKDNHGPKVWDSVDQWGRLGGKPWFGVARITNKHRTIRNAGVPPSSMPSNHMITLRQRWIMPDGLRSFRTGYPLVTDGLRANFFGYDASITIGFHKVEHWIDPFAARTVKPIGLNAAALGPTRVELLNRVVRPNGFNAQNIPITLYIGPPRRIYPSGYTTDLYGTAWLSDRIRRIWPSGEEHLDMDVTPGMFAHRMKVKYWAPPVFVQYVGVPSISPRQMGRAADVVNAAHLIQQINCCTRKLGRPIVSYGSMT